MLLEAFQGDWEGRDPRDKWHGIIMKIINNSGDFRNTCGGGAASTANTGSSAQLAIATPYSTATTTLTYSTCKKIG